jgi:rhomboid family GlyGly-CTERM serine protease
VAGASSLIVRPGQQQAGPAGWRAEAGNSADALGWPWLTLAATLLALAVFFTPGASEALAFDRTRILQGAWWRLWTGHWVHFSGSHLAWNLTVLLPAGICAERLQPGRTRWLFAAGPVVIGLALLGFVPDLARYGGLSGLAAGLLTWLAVLRREAPGADRWFWSTVLGLLALKILGELATGRPLFADLRGAGAQPVPVAHFAGVACAVVLRLVSGRRQK